MKPYGINPEGWSGPALIAHRGGSEWVSESGKIVGVTENTDKAFEGAVRLGCRWMESDLHLTLPDDQGICTLVLFHDAGLGRVTDGRDTRMIGGMTLEEVKKVDLGFDSGVTQRILTLEEALTIWGQHEIRWNLDPKTPEAAKLLIDQIDDILERSKVGRDMIGVGNFSYSNIASIRQELPGIWTSASQLEVVAAILEPVLSKLSRLGHLGIFGQYHELNQKYFGSGSSRPAYDGFQMPFSTSQVRPFSHIPAEMGLPLAGARIIERMHDRDPSIPVHVWTPNSRKDLTSLLCGPSSVVDGIMTDRVGLLLEIMLEQGMAPDQTEEPR